LAKAALNRNCELSLFFYGSLMLRVLRRVSPEAITSHAAVAYFKGAAKRYMPQYRLMAREIAAVAKGEILDVGTGPGFLPIEVGKLLPAAQMVGIDVSEMMVILAKKNKEVSNIDNVSFRRMNGNNLDFADNTLDMVISTDSLHHWREPVAILNEIYRCLKPGCEAWVYDGFSGVTNEEIRTYVQGADSFLFPCWMMRMFLAVHGFTKKEYDTDIPQMVSQTLFKTCGFEQHGIMMRLRLIKLPL